MDRDASASFCIDATHTLEPVDSLEYEDLPWDRVRTHIVTLHFQQLAISTVQILIVTHDTDNPDEIGLWRALPPCNGPHLRQGPGTPTSTLTVPLLLSSNHEQILQPLPHNRSFGKERSNLRILHNCLYHVDPNRQTVHATFESSGAYVVIRDHETADQCFHDFRYLLRIFPLDLRSRDRAPSLPSHIIREIGRNAIEDDEDPASCARTLLSCALIRKYWLDAGTLDLLWTCRAWGQSPLFLPQFRSLANAAKAYHSIAERVVTMPRHVIFYGDNTWKSVDWLEPVDDILSVAHNLKTIDIRCFVFNYSRNRMKVLDHVDNFTISQFHRNHTGVASEWDSPVHFCTVLQTIQKWTKLRRLCLHEWDSESASCSSPPEEPAAYQLCELTLKNGLLPKGSLRHLISYPNQALQRLHLEGVRGITNDELRYVLDATCSTLRSISLSRFRLDVTFRSSPRCRRDEEEFAFDATVNRMVELRGATLHGDSASLLAISRKRMVDGQLRGWISIYDWKPQSARGNAFIRSCRTYGMGEYLSLHRQE